MLIDIFTEEAKTIHTSIAGPGVRDFEGLYSAESNLARVAFLVRTQNLSSQRSASATESCFRTVSDRKHYRCFSSCSSETVARDLAMSSYNSVV